MRFNAPQRVYRPTKTLAAEVQATVKWFDAERGFGFVATDAAESDVFLPEAVVSMAGRQQLPEGTTVVVDIAEGERGPQVSRIYRFDLSTAVPESERSRRGPKPGQDRKGPEQRSPQRPQQRPPQRGERGGERGGERAGGPAGAPVAGPVAGTVKWYDAKKGFGFVATEDGGRDVFVHASVLERAGIRALAENQRVRISVRDGERGREAVTIDEG